jgi:hypothetical protein
MSRPNDPDVSPKPSSAGVAHSVNELTSSTNGREWLGCDVLSIHSFSTISTVEARCHRTFTGLCGLPWTWLITTVSFANLMSDVKHACGNLSTTVRPFVEADLAEAISRALFVSAQSAAAVLLAS